MDLLETTAPVDALLFKRLVSLASVSPLWAWIAVLTAAFGFWRIRTVHSVPSRQSDAPPPPPLPSDAANDESVDGAPPTPSEPAPDVHVEEREWQGVTKGKLTVYYHCADEEVEVDGDGSDGWEVDRGFDGGDLRWKGREAFGAVGWRRRRGDLGWYGYQDLTALNGSVVQLWNAVESRRQSMRVVSVFR
ncbi:hypothetical protein QJS04_geneDACA004862 [Acorus gramineus]|uniref:Uncharacterized protein n=1 Tax=Acorus gramineus TaxID=55184 RepID=A0AAV9BRX0_ACOGR|nr:hypothetical protein QJS04_geneDACA004862 [Acorus gramineus]